MLRNGVAYGYGGVFASWQRVHQQPHHLARSNLITSTVIIITALIIIFIAPTQLTSSSTSAVDRPCKPLPYKIIVLAGVIWLISLQ